MSNFKAKLESRGVLRIQRNIYDGPFCENRCSTGFWIPLCESIMMQEMINMMITTHYVKFVQIRSYFWSVFSCILTEYGPETTPYLDTFHAVTVFHRCLKAKKGEILKY